MQLNNIKNTYILIPSYEPDESLVKLVSNLTDLGFEIILVNDGSSEEYDEIFNKVKDKVHYIKQTPNKGKGVALRMGFTYANINQENKKFVITCDGDGQHATEDIIKVCDCLNKTDQVVFGVRVFDKNTPKRSRDGNFMSRWCRSTITKQYISDDQCGLRGFPLRYMDDLIQIHGNRYEYEMNVVCNFQLKCIPIKELTIETIYIDNNSKSHFSPKLDTYRIQKVIWTFDLVPLLTFILGYFSFVLLSIYSQNFLHPLAIFGIAKIFEFYLQFGLLSLLFPSKYVGRRFCIEGSFFLLETLISFGLIVLFGLVLQIPLPIAYFISTFPVVFLNSPFSFFKYLCTRNK